MLDTETKETHPAVLDYVALMVPPVLSFFFFLLNCAQRLRLMIATYDYVH